MKMVFLSIISSIIMYLVGSTIEIMPTVTLVQKIPPNKKCGTD